MTNHHTLRRRLFRLVQRLSNWFYSRFTTVGRLVFLCLVIATIFALDPRQTHAYQFASVLATTLLVAYFLRVFNKSHLIIKRQLPKFLTVNEPIDYTLSVHNPDKVMIRDLHFLELLTAGNYANNLLIPASIRQVSSWFERKIGFLPWLAEQRYLNGARASYSDTVDISRGATLLVKQSIKPLRRGYVEFSGVQIGHNELLGLMRKVTRYDCPQKILVLPARIKIPQLRWPSRRHYHRGGESLATAVGDSQEFIGLRDYRPGDALRQIHWRSFAKVGKPIVKEYADEYFDRHALVLDTAIEPGDESLFEAAVSVAASFVQAEQPRESLLDLVVIGDKRWRLTAGRGKDDRSGLLEHLAFVSPQSDPDKISNLLLKSHPFKECNSLIYICCVWDPTRKSFIERTVATGVDIFPIRLVSVEDQVSDHWQLAANSVAAKLPLVVRDFNLGRRR